MTLPCAHSLVTHCQQPLFVLAEDELRGMVKLHGLEWGETLPRLEENHVLVLIDGYQVGASGTESEADYR